MCAEVAAGAMIVAGALCHLMDRSAFECPPFLFTRSRLSTHTQRKRSRKHKKDKGKNKRGKGDKSKKKKKHSRKEESKDKSRKALTSGDDFGKYGIIREVSGGRERVEGKQRLSHTVLLFAEDPFILAQPLVASPPLHLLSRRARRTQRRKAQSSFCGHLSTRRLISRRYQRMMSGSCSRTTLKITTQVTTPRAWDDESVLFLL